MQVDRDLSERVLPSRDRVIEDVKRIVGEQMGIDPEKLRETDDLESDVGCDSLDVVEIGMETEEHFDVPVPDDVGERVRTIGAIADAVLELLARR